MRLHGDYELDLSFQRGCGQNIESIEVILCTYTFSLGYRLKVAPGELGVKVKVILEAPAYLRHPADACLRRYFGEENVWSVPGLSDTAQCGFCLLGSLNSIVAVVATFFASPFSM